MILPLFVESRARLYREMRAWNELAGDDAVRCRGWWQLRRQVVFDCLYLGIQEVPSEPVEWVDVYREAVKDMDRHSGAPDVSLTEWIERLHIDITKDDDFERAAITERKLRRAGLIHRPREMTQ